MAGQTHQFQVGLNHEINQWNSSFGAGFEIVKFLAKIKILNKCAKNFDKSKFGSYRNFFPRKIQSKISGALHFNSPTERNALVNQESGAQHIIFRGPTWELLHVVKNKWNCRVRQRRGIVARALRSCVWVCVVCSPSLSSSDLLSSSLIKGLWPTPSFFTGSLNKVPLTSSFSPTPPHPNSTHAHGP